MNNRQYESFLKIRDELKHYVSCISGEDPGIVPVYNYDIDRFDKKSVIKFILLGDNPGREEAAEKRYLVGHAGRQARNFFEGNSLVRDFSQEVLVLNKTFIHTDSTSDLKKIKNSTLFIESQKIMAETAFRLHKVLDCEMWIIGCSEFRPNGLFSLFRDTLTSCYGGEKKDSLRDKLYCYKHFSYGNFSHDLKQHKSPDMNIKLEETGTSMRRKYFGW